MESSFHTLERRQIPRIEILGYLQGHLDSLGVQLSVRDIGLGGFSIDAPFPFLSGTRHRFRFSAAADWSVTVIAIVVHCAQRTADRDGRPSYVAGFEFIIESDEHGTAVDELLDRVTAALSFDPPAASSRRMW